MVWDKATNLVWARCAVGQTWDKKTCTGKAEKFTFDQAVFLPARIKFDIAGFKDWVVPTVRQLATLLMCTDGFTSKTSNIQDGGPLVLKECGSYSLSPTIDANIFPATPKDIFWSSSRDVGDSSYSWFVNFYIGYVDNDSRGALRPVRLLRASQLSDGEAALAFPVRLEGMSNSVFTNEIEKLKDKVKRENAEISAKACNSVYPGKTGTRAGPSSLSIDVNYVVRYVNKDRGTATIEATNSGQLNMNKGEMKEVSCGDL